MHDQVSCPKCGNEFAVGEALHEQARASLRIEMQCELQETLADAKARSEKELTEARVRLEAAAAKEPDLLRMRRELETREANAALDVERRLAEERGKVQAEAERVVEQRLALQAQRKLDDQQRENDARVKQVESDLASARRRIDSAARKEIEMLRREQELEDAKRAIELEAEKQRLADRKQLQEQADTKASERVAVMQEQARLREKEQEEKNAQLQRTVDQLQQRLVQGAQQTQGEAQELLLKDILVEAFGEDTIEDVGKGVNGADLVHHVNTDHGQECGIILWESKRTQSWSGGWLEKLRDDQRAVGAACAVIVTQALPAGVKDFGLVDGVWVCGWSYASALASVLRAGIQEVHRARRAVDGRETKMHVLYDYLVGHEFRNRIQGVMESIVSLQEQLHAEEAAYSRIWKKRGMALRRALTQVGCAYGDLQGIVGAKLEDISHLALPEPAQEDDEVADAAKKGKGRGGSISRVVTGEVAVVRSA